MPSFIQFETCSCRRHCCCCYCLIEIRTHSLTRSFEPGSHASRTLLTMLLTMSSFHSNYFSLSPAKCSSWFNLSPPEEITLTWLYNLFNGLKPQLQRAQFESCIECWLYFLFLLSFFRSKIPVKLRQERLVCARSLAHFQCRFNKSSNLQFRFIEKDFDRLEMENKAPNSNFLVDFSEFDPFSTISSFPNDSTTMTKIMDVDFSHQVSATHWHWGVRAAFGWHLVLLSFRSPIHCLMIQTRIRSLTVSLRSLSRAAPLRHSILSFKATTFGRQMSISTISAATLAAAPCRSRLISSTTRLQTNWILSKASPILLGSNFDQADNSFSISSASPLSSPVFNGTTNNSSNAGYKEKDPFASFNDNDIFQTGTFGIEDGFRQLELENSNNSSSGNNNAMSEKRRIEFKIEPNSDIFTPKQLNESNFVDPSQFDVMLSSPTSTSETPSLSTSSSFLKSSTMSVNTALTGLLFHRSSFDHIKRDDKQIKDDDQQQQRRRNHRRWIKR